MRQLVVLKNCVMQAKLKDVKNMNWCNFIADFLHDVFSNKMYQKGCRLHLMVFFYQSFLGTLFNTFIYAWQPDHNKMATAIIP